MNERLFTLALLEIVLSIVITVLVIFVSYKLLKWFFFRKEELEGDNQAFTIFTAGIVLSIGIILSEILPSITNVIRLSTTQGLQQDSATVITYGLLYLLIGFLVAVLINAAVFFLFSMLTKGHNEFRAIKNNRVSTAILVVAILISITIMVKGSIALLISSLIPYPEVQNYLQGM
jgi:uncharacterized membrane protein YjfL (UPF0719 family)